jgi:hypothetical protein
MSPDIQRLIAHFAIPGEAPFARHKVQAHLIAQGHTKETCAAVIHEMAARNAITDRDEPVVTLPLHAQALLAQHGVKLPENGQRVDIAKLDAQLSASGATVSDRLEIKNVLHAVGAI